MGGCVNSTDTQEPTSEVIEAQSYYNKAREYDKSGQMRLAELYYKKTYETLKENPSQNWALYGDAGFRYAIMLDQGGNIEAAMALAKDLLSEDIRDSERSSLLMMIGGCQLHLGELNEAKQTFAKAYDTSVESYGVGKGEFNMMVICVNIFNSYIEIGEYDEATKWLVRVDEEYTAYEHSKKAKPEQIEEYKGNIAMYHARLLLATGHTVEANAMFDAIPSQCIFTPLSINLAANYLMYAKRYAEASEMYARLDTTFTSIDSTRLTFSRISECLAPRYIANRRAGRVEEALKIADIMSEAIDSALIWQKHNDVAELAMIYQTHEKELALEESKTQTVIYKIIAVSVFALLLLAAYIIWRIRHDNKSLAEKNHLLYKQIQQREKTEKLNLELRKDNFKKQNTQLSQNQQLYNHLCELMQNPEVYTSADTNHETLARLLGTNRTYVGDALRECANLTPTDFINQHRIQYAANLLVTTDEPIGLIAEQCGIPNRSTFNRLFRERYSMSPTEYRLASKETN